MRLTYRPALPSLCVVVCLAVAPGARATDEEEATKTQMKAATTEETSPSESAAVCEEAPVKFNKASGLIGMEVRNQKNEHLGHIKDFVFDLKTERVSYAVLNTGSKVLLSLDDKLLAVPLSALTPSTDQKHLVLNAEKSKVETAMGFDREHWPSATSPVWGAEPFWQSQMEKPATQTESAKEADTKTTEEMNTDPEANPNEDPEMPPKSEPGA
jgi:sporulation protein YlmC with PRC-barrel domain